MKHRTAIIIFVIVVMLVIAISIAYNHQTSVEPTGLANPASVHCTESGYKLEIRTATDGGQYGVCMFTDGTECEEWEFYRGECSPGMQHRVSR